MLAALGPLTAGHLLATLLVILPFALLVALIEWHRQIQIGASLLVIAFGIFRLLDRRHPRALARIRPTQLGLWSFAVAIAHGAGLMLLPIYLGLCRAADFDKGHEAATTLINANLGMAVLVAPDYRYEVFHAEKLCRTKTAISVLKAALRISPKYRDLRKCRSRRRLPMQARIDADEFTSLGRNRAGSFLICCCCGAG